MNIAHSSDSENTMTKIMKLPMRNSSTVREKVTTCSKTKVKRRQLSYQKKVERLASSVNTNTNRVLVIHNTLRSSPAWELSVEKLLRKLSASGEGKESGATEPDATEFASTLM